MCGDISTNQNLSACTPICNSKLHIQHLARVRPVVFGPENIRGAPVQKLANPSMTGETRDIAEFGTGVPWTQTHI
jgi:hypothetical protein